MYIASSKMQWILKEFWVGYSDFIFARNSPEEWIPTLFFDWWKIPIITVLRSLRLVGWWNRPGQCRPWSHQACWLPPHGGSSVSRDPRGSWHPSLRQIPLPLKRSRQRLWWLHKREEASCWYSVVMKDKPRSIYIYHNFNLAKHHNSFIKKFICQICLLGFVQVKFSFAIIEHAIFWCLSLNFSFKQAKQIYS